MAGFARARSLAVDWNDRPCEASRPFDRSRAGFVIGEGAGVVVLEELEHAKARGARIYAELKGYGLSADAYHMTAPREDGEGPFLAMKRALKHAELRPGDVDYVNAHATSTVLGDAAENRAIKSLLLGEHGKDKPSQINVSSTKGAVGHLLGAAGSLEAIFAILSIYNVSLQHPDVSMHYINGEQSTLPPTLNLENPGDPPEDFDCNYTPKTAQEQRVDVALSNSFGFGAHYEAVHMTDTNIQTDQGIPEREQPTIKSFKTKAAVYHERVPGLRKIPFRAVAIILLVAASNVVVWVTAIDLMTRRLIAAGQKPVTVGTFFSLGHSTVVIITSIVVASTAAAVSSKFGAFSRVGGMIGSAVSASFLLLLGAMNVYILFKLVQQLRRLARQQQKQDGNNTTALQGTGCLFYLFKKAFAVIDRPWKMYPLGALFGLGFDTSSEIALLGISAVQVAKGTSVWLILIFPVLFTAGMCLLDTIDGALMLTLYTSTELAKDDVAILYYSVVLTGVTVVVAGVIGCVQLLSLVMGVGNLEGGVWDGVKVAGDHYDVIGACASAVVRVTGERDTRTDASSTGGAVCGSFVVFGGLSVLTYKPWRRRFDLQRRQHSFMPEAQEGISMNMMADGLASMRHGTVKAVGDEIESDTVAKSGIDMDNPKQARVNEVERTV
ncbi:hypothetical protein LTR04_006512 [Oleoguttula sp. CCFEE 6159]|nr:hypothetical protein LTR04_006512 [Oleoguttula sp. CCFEE 6159]